MEPDSESVIKTEASDPTSEYDMVILDYDLGEFSMNADTSTTFTLDYPKEYKNVPHLFVAYDYDDSNGDTFRVETRTTAYSASSCDITFGNLRTAGATITAKCKVTLIIPK